MGEDFVNLPADQIANIWLAAHIKTKKPMQLRHYGQCLIGISWIHYKQVEYLHNDCNDAFSKARLVLVRKRNVDLDPLAERGRDITLPEHQHSEQQTMDIELDLNANNLSQLYLDDDIMNMSENGSLLGTDSTIITERENKNNSNHNALASDHEITMADNQLFHASPSRTERRSSFGNISSLLMGDMDIEIKFDDEEDNEIMEESQAQRADIEDVQSMTDIEIEQGRGNETNSIGMSVDNQSDSGSIHLPQKNQLIESHINLEKEDGVNLVDAMSAHSGSVGVGNIDNMNMMDLDQQSVELEDVQSNVGSVATANLNEEQHFKEKATPPPTPRAMQKKEKNKKEKKLKRKKKKKKKKRFSRDKQIEFEREELRETNLENASFLYRGGRDAVHIWREFPLSTLSFDELLNQPLSKGQFQRFPQEISQHFALCNKAKPQKEKNDETEVDELCDPNILVEQARDNQSEHAMEHDLDVPVDDISDSLQQKDGNDDAMSMHLEVDHDKNELLDDDNASTLDSVVNDNILPPDDPLFDHNEEALEVPQDSDGDDVDIQNMPNSNNSNHLSFDTNDENIMTQMESVEDEQNNNNGEQIKPRDWSRRARKTFAYFKRKEGKQFSFNELMQQQTKRETVVGVFYELLVFKNSDLVELEQEEPFGDITITKTNNFYRHARISQKLSQRMSGNFD